MLQSVRTSNDWETFVLFMQEGIEQTSKQTTELIRNIKLLMQSHKNAIKTKLPKIYSQDLLNNLFKHPYTKIEFIMEELNIHRLTAAKHFNQLVDIGLLTKTKVHKENYYLNHDLSVLLASVGRRNLKI